MRVAVYGSRPDGHARVVIELFSDRFEVVGLLDDFAENADRTIGDLAVLGGSEIFGELGERGIEGILLDFGGTRGRLAVVQAARAAGVALPAALHHSCGVAASAAIGDGVVALPKAYLGPGCRIGDAVLINVGAIVSHDVIVGDGAVIDPGAILTGRASIGQETEIGAGAVVLPDVHIGRAAIVGAGAVVIRDVADGVTVVGVPARPIARDA
jgi:acetyltransferase EpsM